MTHNNYKSRATHITGLELDDDEKLGLFWLHFPKPRWRTARLQVAREAVLHPLLPWQILTLLSLFFAKGAELSAEFIHLVALLGFKLMQT